MPVRGFLTLLLCSALGALSQSPTNAPQINSVFTAALNDTSFGPGTGIVVLGAFPPRSATQDYTMTVAGQTTGITLAGNAVFLLATIPANASPGLTTLVITYQGQSSNALPLNVATLAPQFTTGPITVTGPQDPPQYSPYLPFAHYPSTQPVSPVSPAALGETLQASLFGVGTSVPPAVVPVITVGGQKATILQASPSTGRVTIYFTVPANASLGINSVVATVAGVASNTATLPLGNAPAIASVLNGASYRSSGVVAPGSIVSVFGAGFGAQDVFTAFPSTTVNGLSVLFGTAPAPIFALGATFGQINVLVPNELPYSGTVNVTVKNAAGASAVTPITLTAAVPGLFYYGDPLVPGRHNAVAVIANTAWISMPASMAATYGLSTNCAALTPASLCAQAVTRGGYLQLYVTGLGKATPNGDPNGSGLTTGSVAPANGNPIYLTVATPTVTIGGQPALVLFSGIGPGYNGLYQVNVQVPANITPGNDVPIQISLAGISDSATVAVQ